MEGREGACCPPRLPSSGMLTQLTAGNILPHRIICHNYPIQMSLFSGRVRMILAVAFASAGRDEAVGECAAVRLYKRRRSGGRRGPDTLISRPLTCTRCITLSPRESNVEMSYGPTTGLVEYFPASEYLHSDMFYPAEAKRQACSPRRLAMAGCGACVQPFSSTELSVGWSEMPQRADERACEVRRRPGRWEWWCLTEGGVIQGCRPSRCEGCAASPLPSQALPFLPPGQRRAPTHPDANVYLSAASRNFSVDLVVPGRQARWP